MKARMGMLLAGVLAAYLLISLGERKRRDHLTDLTRPVGQRLRGAKEWMAESDTLTRARESAPPVVARTLSDAASSLQSGIKDTASAFAAQASRVGALRQTVSGETKAPEGPGDPAVDVAPRAIFDPIPEGSTNDPTLVARVESELFRDDTLPKGRLNIDAANGVVTLRGSLDSDQLAEDVTERIRAIDGVSEVVDLVQRRSTI